MTEFEVLVVDDGSAPPAEPVLARYAHSLPLRGFTADGGGPARARNLALRQAAGDYVVFTDDDCAPDRGWLRAYARAFASMPEAGLGGTIVDAAENGLCGRASQALISFLYEYFGTKHALSFFCSNNFAFPRRQLLGLGGFDESFPLPAAEDRDLCARWKQQGELCFVPDAVIVHRQTLSFGSFCRQQYRYGRGAFQFWLRRRQDGSGGHRLERWRFYRELLLFPFGKENFLRALGMSLLLAVSQGATVLGYFAASLRRIIGTWRLRDG